MIAEIDWRCWAIGLYWDWDLIGLDLGPLDVRWDLPDEPLKRFCWSATLVRWVVRRWKLDIRVEVDSYIWRVGYIMAAPWDHGLYLGPFNVQIEYDVMYDLDY